MSSLHKSNIDWKNPIMRKFGGSLYHQIKTIHLKGIRSMARIHGMAANILENMPIQAKEQMN